jgi:hypothetical protein
MTSSPNLQICWPRKIDHDFFDHSHFYADMLQIELDKNVNDQKSHDQFF